VTAKAALIVMVLSLLAPFPAIASPSTCWIKGDDGCRQYVGKRLWVVIPANNPNVVEVTFVRGDWSNTLKLKSGASFVVKGLQSNSSGSPDYVVELDDGRRGWIGSSQNFLIDHDPVAMAKRAVEECKRRGQPKIGMTAVELTESCGGRPRRVIKRTTAAGSEELYIYGIGYRVTLTDGKVSEIVEAR